jgi:hypothetical protein
MMILDEIAPWFGSGGRKQRKGNECKGKEMKGKLLSFAFIYFSESGLFKELQRIKIKKSFAASAGLKSGARALSSVHRLAGSSQIVPPIGNPIADILIFSNRLSRFLTSAIARPLRDRRLRLP